MKTASVGIMLFIAIVVVSSADMASAHRSSVPNVTASETAPYATITVFPVCVPLLPGIRGLYWTEDGSATAGEDYEAVSGQFPLFEGGAPRTFRIPLIDDRIREGDETVRVRVLLLNDEV